MSTESVFVMVSVILQYVVQFVDYGNHCTVHKDELRELTPAIASIPAAALKCHLKDLVPKVNCVDKASA